MLAIFYIVERNGNALRVVRLNGLIETVAGTGKNPVPKERFPPSTPNSQKTETPGDFSTAGIVYIADDMNPHDSEI